MASLNDLSTTVPLEPPASRSVTWLTAGNRRLRRIQVAVAVTMALLVLMVVVRLWAVVGWWTPVRIVGGSMAEAYHGSHFEVLCADCGFIFRCDAAHVPAEGRVVCPNCGYRLNQLTDSQVRLGDRVLIDRWPLWWGSPWRGSVVAFRQPEGENLLAVKRIVATPGEQLAIVHGDLYLNGRIHRKSLAQLNQQAVLVHDNGYRPTHTADLPPRWQSQTPGTGWRVDGAMFKFVPPVDHGSDHVSASQEFDWLTYRHWSCVSSPEPRTAEAAILDNDSYNQGLSRQLNAVSDVMLRCRVKAAGQGHFALAAVDGQERFEVTIDPRLELLALRRSGQRVIEREVAKANPYHWNLTLALCDQRVLVADGTRVLLEYTYERDEPCETFRPLAIGARGLELSVTNLQVWRDVYYLEPLGTSRSWNAESSLPGGHFALLGDNPPISTDSRHWPAAGVPSRDVLGTILRPFWSSQK